MPDQLKNRNKGDAGWDKRSELGPAPWHITEVLGIGIICGSAGGALVGTSSKTGARPGPPLLIHIQYLS